MHLLKWGQTHRMTCKMPPKENQKNSLGGIQRGNSRKAGQLSYVAMLPLETPKAVVARGQAGDCYAPNRGPRRLKPSAPTSPGLLQGPSRVGLYLDNTSSYFYQKEK